MRIKYEQILSREQDLSQKYLNFLNENKNTIFTVKKDKKHPDGVLYTFKGNDLWLFHENDLEIVKKKGEYHDKSRKENKNVGNKLKCNYCL